MEQADYQREINRLENELNHLEADLDSTSPVVSSSKTRLAIYLPYFGLVIGCIIFLYAVKPKVVLRITIINEQPRMVLDYAKFVVWSIVVSTIACLSYHLWTRFRKGKT